MSRAVAAVLLATAAALACAQPGSPPGGPIDDSPPRVIETRPAAFDTLTDLDAQVIIRFDERISERLEGVAELREAVLISPATGVPIVDQDRRGIKVRPAGGWQPDRVYRVVILPVFRDLFGNQREVPVELVFSTGAPITESALAGFVVDRITGDVVPDARIAARTGDGDSHVAVTDTAGFFAMRFIPPGRYAIQGWLDQDRDREVDFFEAQDTTDATFAAGDTVVVEMALLPMDSTAARLARAEPVDSTRIRLVFDDYFAVDDSMAGTARVYSLPDTTLVTDAGRLVHGARLDSILAAEEAAREALRAEQAARDSLQAIQDSLAAIRDAAVVDTLPALAAPDTADRPADRRVAAPGVRPARDRPRAADVQARPAAPAADERLPSRELILFLPAPLEPDTAYWVEVDGVVNIRGVPGGGGTAAFRTPAPPDTMAADTMATDTVARDSAGEGVAVPDTGRLDTVPVPADTVGPDTDPERRPVTGPDTVPDTAPYSAPHAVPAAGRIESILNPEGRRE